MEIPWFLTMWSLLLAFFVAGFIFGNFQKVMWGYIWRFFKRGFGIIDEVKIDVALEVLPAVLPAEPRYRTVGTQSQTNYDMTLTRFDTMRFVAQNQGFFRAGEVEIVNH